MSVESLLSGDRVGIGGILCNDPNGLCLISKGKMTGSREATTEDTENINPTSSVSGTASGAGNGNVDEDKSGCYTSLVRLASQLQDFQQQQQQEEGDLGSSATATSTGTPLITIETDIDAILVKEYDGGHTIAMRVPRT